MLSYLNTRVFITKKRKINKTELEKRTEISHLLVPSTFGTF